MVNIKKTRELNDKAEKMRKSGELITPVGVNPATLNNVDRFKYALLKEIFLSYKKSHRTLADFSKCINENKTTVCLMLKLTYERFSIDKILKVYWKISESPELGSYLNSNFKDNLKKVS